MKTDLSIKVNCWVTPLFWIQMTYYKLGAVSGLLDSNQIEFAGMKKLSFCYKGDVYVWILGMKVK
jgi:hypothetical protein